jgi:hypothetical protein
MSHEASIVRETTPFEIAQRRLLFWFVIPILDPERQDEGQSKTKEQERYSGPAGSTDASQERGTGRRSRRTTEIHRCFPSGEGARSNVR